MLIRQDGEWVHLAESVDFSTHRFTVDFVRNLAYNLGQQNASRGRIIAALRKFEVEDPETQWGVGKDTIQRLLEEVSPTRKEEQTLW